MNDAASCASTFGTQKQRTVKLRQKLAYLRGQNRSKRAIKFNQRLEAVQPGVDETDFNRTASLPDWILLPDEDQALIGLSAAILSERDAIDRELSGERLIAIAATVGDELFEKLCEVTLFDNTAHNTDMPMSQLLSRPEDFLAIGHDIRLRAVHDNYARSLCDIAASVVMTQNDQEGVRV